MPDLTKEQIAQIKADLGLNNQATPPPQGAPNGKSDWRARCVMSDGKRPRPMPVVENACLALEHDPHWTGKLTFDQMRQAALLAASEPRPVTDDDITNIQRWLQRAGLKALSHTVTGHAVHHVARQNPFHPLRNMLAALHWDGIERLSLWTHSYLGTENTDYTRAVGRMFLVSMVARILTPGCKADYMLVLEGPQGVLKSTACRILAGDEYFSDNLPDLTDSKEVSIHLQGKWLIEVAEMHAFSRAEATLLKQFLSRQAEQFRPPYGIHEVTIPRQCVFIGTSNKDHYLRDETGGRRFWPLVTGSINLDALRRDRDQILAEAYQACMAREPFYPSPVFEAEHITPQQEARYEFDPWFELVQNWLEDHALEVSFTTHAIADGIGLKADRLDPVQGRRIGAIMRKLNWKLKHSMRGNRWTRDPPP
jgi:predicted P-loop ATPase